MKIDACIINQTPEFCKGLLDGRGIKGEGENDAPPDRHTGFKAVSTG